LRYRAALLASLAGVAACDVTLRFEGDAGFVDAVSTPDSPASCAPERTACDGTCLDASFDSAACGAAPVCSDGGCACVAPTTLCSGACVNLKSDHNHCGDCSRVCSNGEHCSNGQCVMGGSNEAGP
jgi:hypothetical protein